MSFFISEPKAHGCVVNLCRAHKVIWVTRQAVALWLALSKTSPMPSMHTEAQPPDEVSRESKAGVEISSYHRERDTNGSKETKSLA